MSLESGMQAGGRLEVERAQKKLKCRSGAAENNSSFAKGLAISRVRPSKGMGQIFCKQAHRSHKNAQETVQGKFTTLKFY